MSSLFERHPDRDLVRYLDGELSTRRAGKIARHLDSCGQCRAELDELQNLLAECAHSHQSRLAQMPAAPTSWRDLSRDFSRIDRSLANTSLLVRLIRPLVHAGAPRWAFVVGLTVLIVLISLNQLRQAPSVQAATLLRKAVAVSQANPRRAHRIRVRTSNRLEFTRLSGSQAAVLQVAEMQAVMALFQAAHYDWNDPLSARAFDDWREAQVYKTDDVAVVNLPQAPSGHFTRIRTVSADGELAAASITLDTDDYAPVEERLEFRDSEWVELSDIAETSTESAGGSGAGHVEAPVRAAEPPSRPAAFTPRPAASVSDELQVLAALNEIGADLGDWVEVGLADGKVKVAGSEGIPQRRQDEIRAAVANLPNVEVEFSPAHSVTIPPDAAAAVAAPNASSTAQTKLEKQLGSHAEFDRFSTQVLDLDEAAMQHVYALHRLAQKFAPEQEAQLSAKDLALLHELSRKHTVALSEKVAGMERILAPTLTSLGGAAGSSHPAGQTKWQPAADDVYTSARRVDRLVSQLLGMTSANVPNNALPSDLMAALSELRANLAGCDQLLK